MTEGTDLTYYQRNRDVVLNKAKDYYKNNKERLREQARKETYQKKRRTKKENMGRIDFIICLKKRNKN